MDDIDLTLLSALQDDCKTSLAQLGELVGMSAPSVLERIRKLEAAGVITGYHAALDAKRAGLDVAAFIGVGINYPKNIDRFEEAIADVPEVLECHHITGGWSLLLKVRARDTSALEAVISRIRSIDGVDRTETMVVLSTSTEHGKLHLEAPKAPPPPPKKRRK